MFVVLLDTMVVSGIFSYLKSGEQDEKCKGWSVVISKLLKAIPRPSRITIPTPVFFEIARKDSKSYNVIFDRSKNQSNLSIFQYINNSITSNILWKATCYKLALNNKGNLSWMDSIIAAYCLVFDHYLITENQKDFPERFFSFVAVELAPLPGSGERTSVYLLKPRCMEFIEYCDKLK